MYDMPVLDLWVANNPNVRPSAFTDDVSQLHLGTRCAALVLSESSFHVWLAYLAAPEARQLVVAFNGTEPARMALPGWTVLEP